MLKFLSKRGRSKSILLIIIISAIAVGIAIAFVPNQMGLFSGSAAGSGATVAKVGGYTVTLKELQDGLKAFGQQLQRNQGSRGRGDDLGTLYSMYGQGVLDNLIRQKLIQYLAEDLNLAGTDDEVKRKLREIINPWPGGPLYRERVRNAGYVVEEFEENVRASITEEKLRGLITAAAQISDADVEEDFRRNKTNYTVRWVEVDPEKFRDKVQFQESELRAYFDQHKDQFRIDTEQRKARYIFIDHAKAGETIQLSDEELKKNFNAERGVRQVKVSQIVLNIPRQKVPEIKPPAAAKPPAASKNNSNKNSSAQPPSNAGDPAQIAAEEAKRKAAEEARKKIEDANQKAEDEVRKKADEIVSRAKGSEGKPAEDFAKLAREVSQDAGTRGAGGDLGWIDKKAKRDTEDPLNRAVEMALNEVSTPIKKGDKFYILKVTDRKIPTFEESRTQLLKEAQVSRGYTKAVAIADEVAEKFKSSKDAQAVVNEINATYKVEVAAVKDSPFFSATESPKGLASEFVVDVFDRKETGEISDRLNLPDDNFAVAQYTEKRDPHEPAFEEVKDRVEDSFRNDKAKDLAIAQARELAKAGGPDALKAAAEKVGLKIDSRKDITGSDGFGPLTSEYDRKLVYNLNPGELTKEPIKPSGGNTYVVAALDSRKDPDMATDFKKDEKSIRDKLLSDQKEILFSTYLEEAQKRLKNEGKIKIYRDVINSAFGSDSAIPPPTPGAPGRRRMPGIPR
ncbi:MAG TPA: SurA N-terminal domain-containing protein [Blastocatellia bacterium]|nr:SurA N-terminal domain-containing protein [Blastocatellia bacterium]